MSSYVNCFFPSRTSTKQIPIFHLSCELFYCICSCGTERKIMGFGALRSILRPVSRTLLSAHCTGSSFSLARTPAAASGSSFFGGGCPLHRDTRQMPVSSAFHSLTDNRFPKRRPSDKPRRKRASLRPPGSSISIFLILVFTRLLFCWMISVGMNVKLIMACTELGFLLWLIRVDFYLMISTCSVWVIWLKMGKRFLSHVWVANEVRIGGRRWNGEKGTFWYILFCFSTKIVGIGEKQISLVVFSKKQRDCSWNSNV